MPITSLDGGGVESQLLVPMWKLEYFATAVVRSKSRRFSAEDIAAYSTVIAPRLRRLSFFSSPLVSWYARRLCRDGGALTQLRDFYNGSVITSLKKMLSLFPICQSLLSTRT